jgi:hypothetical protein
MILFLLPLLRHFLSTTWWLNNTGQFLGLPHEDINFTGFDSDLLTGAGITIVSMADGANAYHRIYANRSIPSGFLDSFTNAEQPYVPNPMEHGVGQRMLGTAVGSPGICESDGVAPQARVMSFNFWNASSRNESLQYVICHHSDHWNIALLTYKIWNCIGRECQYIPASVLPRTIASDCLYDRLASNGSRAKLFVTPNGLDGRLTDVFFTPPTRWPLVFTVNSISNRGLPINRVAEGSGLFISCPGTRLDQDTPPAYIHYATPETNTSCSKSLHNVSFEYTNASAAMFAGAMAIVLQANPQLGLADLWYLFAMTATKANNFSVLWKQNQHGLWFNRRLGFGRLNLGKAVALARIWGSPGLPYNTGVMNATIERAVLIPLTECDANDPRARASFEFEVKGVFVLVMAVRMKTRDFGFGSVIVHLRSPSNTTSELKILTEWSTLNQNIQQLDLTTNEFLGEPLEGTWIVDFPQVDSADRGLVEEIELIAYYARERPDRSFANQENGQDPFQPLDESAFTFIDDRLTMAAGKTFTTNISWRPEGATRRKCFYNAWLQTPGQRVKLKTDMTNNNQTLHLEYVPSVFRTGTPMNLTIESLIDGCGISRTVPVRYAHDWSSVGHVINFGQIRKTYDWIGNDTIRVPLTDWLNPSVKFRITWHQNLTELIDDGYSCSACISLITVDTKQVVRRTFERNLGQVDGYTPWLNGNVPSNRRYRLEISPSSAMREGFKPLYVYLEMVPIAGTYRPYTPPFTEMLTIGIVLVMAANFVFVGARIWMLARHKAAQGEETAPFKSGRHAPAPESSTALLGPDGMPIISYM